MQRRNIDKLRQARSCFLADFCSCEIQPKLNQQMQSNIEHHRKSGLQQYYFLTILSKLNIGGILSLQVLIFILSMDSSIKATLLLHIELNRNFIEEKLYDAFKMECLQFKTINVLDIKKLKNTIIYVLNIGNSQMSLFHDTLEPNIKAFIKQKTENSTEEEDTLIDIEKLSDIMLYCVNEGFPKQEKQERVQEKEIVQVQQGTVEQPKQIHHQIEHQNPEWERPKKKKQNKAKPKVSTFLERPSTPVRKQFKLEKFDMPDINVGPRYLQMAPKNPKMEKEVKTLENVDPIDLEYLSKHKKQITQRLQKLYTYYCSQQPSLGQNSTFDRIKSQTQKMNIGRFLLFCKITNIFAPVKDINIRFLSSSFKKESEGHKQIQFCQFESLLQNIDNQYVKRMRDQDSNAQVPTYEARLYLNEAGRYKEMKKQVNLSFSTKEKQGRELKEWRRLKSERYQELTAHTGKLSIDLKAMLKQKEGIRNALSTPKKNRVNGGEVKKMIKLEDMNSQKWSGINWVIEEDDSDHLYLPEYKLRDVVGNLKRRVNQLEKLENGHKRLH